MSKQSKQHTGNKSLRARKANSILEISLWVSKTYFQYAVGFACSQRLISSMLLAFLAPKDGSKQSKQHTGNKSLGAIKANSILEISL
jgi:hypothetical protein